MRRTKEEAEQTRKNLIRIAVHVFREKSFAATRMSDIAEAAGVTRGAIYHHFGSKVELLKAVALEHRNFFTGMVEEVLKKEGLNTIVAIKQMIHSIFHKLVADVYFRHFMEILLKSDIKKEFPEIADLFGENKYEGYNQLVAIVEDGKEKGSVRKDLDSMKYAFFVISTIFGIIAMWIENQERLDLVGDAEILSDFICAPLRS